MPFPRPRWPSIAMCNEQSECRHFEPTSSVNHGFPSFCAGAIRAPQSPSIELVQETLDQIRTNLDSAAEAMKEQRDAQLTGRTYAVGDKVWVNARVFAGQDGPPKLHCAFYGPYEITHKVNPNVYQLLGLPAGIHPTQNVSELRPFEESPERFNSRPRQPIPQPTMVDGEEEWEVDDILAYRVRGARIEYQVKWTDCPQTSWVSRSQLENAPDTLSRFERAHGLAEPIQRRRGGQHPRSDEVSPSPGDVGDEDNPYNRQYRTARPQSSHGYGTRSSQL